MLFFDQLNYLLTKKCVAGILCCSQFSCTTLSIDVYCVLFYRVFLSTKSNLYLILEAIKQIMQSIYAFIVKQGRCCLFSGFRSWQNKVITFFSSFDIFCHYHFTPTFLSLIVGYNKKWVGNLKRHYEGVLLLVSK